jgi:hypothetical protein
MMTRWMFAALLLLVGGMLLLFSSTAKCSWCPSYRCFGAGTCGQGCQCITWGGETSGRCVSVEGE